MKLDLAALKDFPQYAYNAIKTPDGTVLVSKNAHDVVEHTDANGETYVNDGGLYYLKRSENTEAFEDLAVPMDEDIAVVREVFLWGTYGKNANPEKDYIVLKDMSDAHVKAIIDDGLGIAPLMSLELEYRKANNIYKLDN